MPTALFVSPHLDDVAFSCGGTVVRLGRAGWRTVVVTVFTASVPSPQGFALDCQLDKGLGSDVDYLALRRDEDLRFARRAGVSRCTWLDLAEAPHRGYGSPAELFGDYADADDAASFVAARLQECLDDEQPDLLFAPQALGGHVDHRRVADAIASCGDPATVLWYADLPYAIRHPDARAPLPAVDALPERALDIAASIDDKADAIAAYDTQLPFQFGGPDVARRTLIDHATGEAVRLGCAGAVEVVRTAMPLEWADAAAAASPTRSTRLRRSRAAGRG